MMRDVVVIGGGLSGLSACYQLEKLGVSHTVVEVKRRFGGGIRSTVQRGFVMDASAFVFPSLGDEDWLTELGLRDQMLPNGEDRFVFRDGAESLVRALASNLGGGRLMRMAVSSIGRWRGRFTICLENGMVYDAGALILAVPAPYAARMLYNLAPEAAQRLSETRYDSIQRLSLGYHKRDLPASIDDVGDERFPFVLSTDQPGRVPDRDHRLLQVGVRAAADQPAQDLVRQVAKRFGFGESPIVSRLDYWLESDPIFCKDDKHAENMRLISELLPTGVSLIGSDYCLESATAAGVERLDERIQMGRRAAHDAVACLQVSRKR